MYAYAEDQQLDLSATLSNKDLACLLMEYCNNRIRDENNHERTLTDDKVEMVINSFRDGIKTIQEAFYQCNSVQAERVSNIDLLVNTTNTYFEHLIANLNSNLCNATLALNDHIGSCLGTDLDGIISSESFHNMSQEINESFQNMLQATSPGYQMPPMNLHNKLGGYIHCPLQVLSVHIQ